MKTTAWQFEAPWLQSREPDATRALGWATWLWMHDLRHRKEALQDMEHRLLAPIEAGQYMIARKPSVAPHPLALLLFARFDEQAEARYRLDPSRRMALRDWCSGERLWLIDWTAPFGHTLELHKPAARWLARHGVQGLQRAGGSCLQHRDGLAKV